MKLSEVYHLIIYCLNCIDQRDQISTYKARLRNKTLIAYKWIATVVQSNQFLPLTARFTFTHCNQMYETGSIQATANQTYSLACEQLRRKKCPVYTNSLICSNIIIFVRQLFNMSAVHSSEISLYISNFHLPNTSLIENMKTVLRAVANFPKFD